MGEKSELEKFVDFIKCSADNAENVAKYWSQFEPSMAMTHIATAIDALCYSFYGMSKEDAERFRKQLFDIMQETNDNFDM